MDLAQSPKQHSNKSTPTLNREIHTQTATAITKYRVDIFHILNCVLIRWIVRSRSFGLFIHSREEVIEKFIVR